MNDEYMTQNDFAALLGVSVRTVRRWRSHPYRPHNFPHEYQPTPNRPMFKRSEVEAWIATGRFEGAW